MNEPGTIYSYCNAGYCILGRIIEKVTGKTYEQNLRNRIFEPLGMSNSGYDRNRYVIKNRASGYTYGPFGLENADYIEMDSTPGAAGALYSTVEDMFLWDRALYTDKLLEKRFRDLMFSPNKDVPEVKAAGGRPRSVYGYGWQIYARTHPNTKRRTKVINHGGAILGFRAMENRLVSCALPGCFCLPRAVNKNSLRLRTFPPSTFRAKPLRSCFQDLCEQRRW